MAINSPFEATVAAVQTSATKRQRLGGTGGQLAVSLVDQAEETELATSMRTAELVQAAQEDTEARTQAAAALVRAAENASSAREVGRLEAQVNVLRETQEDLARQLQEAKERGRQLAIQLEENETGEGRTELQRFVDMAESRDVLSKVDRALLGSFLEHTLSKRAMFGETVKNVAIHFSSVMGLQNYLLLANLWHLPKESWIKARRRELKDSVHIGNMPRQWERVASGNAEVKNMYILVQDETRIISKLEGYVGDFGAKIVGNAWLPDPESYCTRETLPDVPETFVGLRDYVRKTVDSGLLAENVEVSGTYCRLGFLFHFMSVGLCCATDPTVSMRVVAAVPHAKDGYTVLHTLKKWAFARYFASHQDDGTPRSDEEQIPLVGVATDSCGVQLAAMVLQGTPTQTEVGAGVKFVGLDDKDYAFVGKVGGGYGRVPFISHGDWEHLLRTDRRNLENPRTILSFGFGERGEPNAVASMSVIRSLKAILHGNDDNGGKGGYLSPILKFNRFMEQNGDAANRLFNRKTIDLLEEHAKPNGLLPEGKATVLYLTMVNQMLAPIENPNFGTPFEMAESMWSGLYTMRLWREYVRTKGNLTTHFQSLASYRTHEVIVHGCVNHFLVSKLVATHLNGNRRWPLRHIPDSRPMEGRFGLVRGGVHANNLSANKTLNEFIEALAFSEGSDAAKIYLETEGAHVPKRRGKRDTFALKKGEPDYWKDFDDHDKDLSYADFRRELSDAKAHGLLRAHEQIEKWAPAMAASLKEECGGYWQCPMPDFDDWRAVLGEHAKTINGSDVDFAKFGLPMKVGDFVRTHLDKTEIERAEKKQQEAVRNRRAQGLPDLKRDAGTERASTLLPPSAPLTATVHLDETHVLRGALMGLSSAGASDHPNAISTVELEVDGHVDPTVLTFTEVLSTGTEERAVEAYFRSPRPSSSRNTEKNFVGTLNKAKVKLAQADATELFEELKRVDSADDYSAFVALSKLPRWARAVADDSEESDGTSHAAFVSADREMILLKKGNPQKWFEEEEDTASRNKEKTNDEETETPRWLLITKRPVVIEGFALQKPVANIGVATYDGGLVAVVAEEDGSATVSEDGGACGATFTCESSGLQNTNSVTGHVTDYAVDAAYAWARVEADDASFWLPANFCTEGSDGAQSEDEDAATESPSSGETRAKKAANMATTST